MIIQHTEETDCPDEYFGRKHQRAPIIVDQDFQYLYQGLRIDPDLVKRASKGEFEECSTKT